MTMIMLRVKANPSLAPRAEITAVACPRLRLREVGVGGRAVGRELGVGVDEAVGVRCGRHELHGACTGEGFPNGSARGIDPAAMKQMAEYNLTVAQVLLTQIVRVLVEK